MGNIISWDSVMKGALSMPGVKVNRDSFLASTFGPYGFDASNAKDANPATIYSEQLLNQLADGVIKNHTNKVTAISAAAGIPGGLAMIGTVPADLAQYYWHYLVMAQKLAYIYGWPDLRDENNNLGEGAQALLTIFVGIGFGVNGANALIKEIAEQAAKHLAKRIPKIALTKTAWYPVVKKIAAMIGVKITKDSVGKAAGKIVPLIGAVVSGGLTYATFKPMAKKLKDELCENASIYRNELGK